MENLAKVNSFKDLKVWQRSMEYAVSVIRIVENNESTRKHYRLIEQMESAVTSVSMNIAEGYGRNSSKEYVHFLRIARGSLYETITLLNIFAEMNWIKHNLLEELETESNEIGKMINGLIRAIQKTNN